MAVYDIEADGLRGLNVTLPHKESVIPLSVKISPLVAVVGAANTLTRHENGGWIAENTDVGGFDNDFREFLGMDYHGGRILVLGAGGAARSVVRALHRGGADLVIANRTLERAEDICRVLAIPMKRAITLDQVIDSSVYADAVVNCLSLGHLGGAIDIAESEGDPFYDISYGQAAEPALALAQRRGWRVRDGLGMLVGQAALSFEIWHGQAPDRDAALKRCRTALEGLQ